MPSLAFPSLARPFSLLEKRRPTARAVPKTPALLPFSLNFLLTTPSLFIAGAIAAGGTERSPVREHEHQPFGHIWLFGKFL